MYSIFGEVYQIRKTSLELSPSNLNVVKIFDNVNDCSYAINFLISNCIDHIAPLKLIH